MVDRYDIDGDQHPKGCYVMIEDYEEVVSKLHKSEELLDKALAAGCGCREREKALLYRFERARKALSGVRSHSAEHGLETTYELAHGYLQWECDIADSLVEKESPTDTPATLD